MFWFRPKIGRQFVVLQKSVLLKIVYSIRNYAKNNLSLQTKIFVKIDRDLF